MPFVNKFSTAVLCIVASGYFIACCNGSDGVDVEWVLATDLSVKPRFPTESVYETILNATADSTINPRDLIDNDQTFLHAHFALSYACVPERIWYERTRKQLLMHVNGITVVNNGETIRCNKPVYEYPELEAEIQLARNGWDSFVEEYCENNSSFGKNTRMRLAIKNSRAIQVNRNSDLMQAIVKTATLTKDRRDIVRLRELANTDVSWSINMFHAIPEVKKITVQLDCDVQRGETASTLIEMLKDKDKFIVAHVLLLRMFNRHHNIRRTVKNNGNEVEVACDQLYAVIDNTTGTVFYPEVDLQHAWINVFWRTGMLATQ